MTASNSHGHGIVEINDCNQPAAAVWRRIAAARLRSIAFSEKSRGVPVATQKKLAYSDELPSLEFGKRNPAVTAPPHSCLEQQHARN